MPPESESSTSDIDRALQALRQQRPGWEELLDFYGRLFKAQRESRTKTRVGAIDIDSRMLALKAGEALPLVNLDEFVIDTRRAAELLNELCQLAVFGNRNLQTSARKIKAGLAGGRVQAGHLFDCILSENSEALSRAAQSLEVDDQALSFFSYNSIKPSLELCARQLETFLDPDLAWEKGYCPVCGTSPVISILGSSGERKLVCGFCWHQWTARRLSCPFCGNTDSKTLSYFFSESEKDCRVYVCEQCRKYLKSVDSREIDRPLIAELEHMATLHFDVKAIEMGYESGINLHLNI
jgi:FdhE protein